MTSGVHKHVNPQLLASERRTRIVVVITAIMMVAEIAVGTLTHSLALLADGWHMASHAGALGLSAWAYWYARRHAESGHYSFGTGKLLALAGYTNAVALLLVACVMAFEAVQRLWHPEPVQFDEALIVAVIGLAVNLVSAWLLDVSEHQHDHDHRHDHDHKEHSHRHGADSNLRAAYMHVAADALTSVLAVLALLGGKWRGWTFLDPAMAIVGSLVIAKWGIGLCRTSAQQLLDANPLPSKSDAIRHALEQMGATRVVDLHVWEIGPSEKSCIVSLVTTEPRTLEEYRTAVLNVMALTHLTIEVERVGVERMRALS